MGLSFTVGPLVFSVELFGLILILSCCLCLEFGK